jgi:hypothetical protein
MSADGSAVLIPVERRRSVRFGTSIPALIHADACDVLLSCTVLDVSEGGGRIRLDAPAILPDHFTLVLTSNGRVRRACRVIWRHDIYLGVAFSGRFDHA